MSESTEKTRNSIENLQTAYKNFKELNTLNKVEKENSKDRSYTQLRERIIHASAVEVNYNSTMAQLAMAQQLSTEINSLKKEIINQTKAHQESACLQRWLTGAIIFIGIVSLVITFI